MQDVNQAAITLQNMNCVSAVSCLDPFASNSEALGAKIIARTTHKTPRPSDKRQNSHSKAVLTYRSMQKAIGRRS